jgi:hypothetical protein
MEARNQLARSTQAHDVGASEPPTRRDSGIRPTAPEAARDEDERGSGAQLVEDRKTQPPPGWPGASDDVVVAHIRLHPSVDEVLYRLSLGDERGAFLAAADLEALVPRVIAGHVILVAMRLTYLEEYILSYVDACSTWAEILDSSPFAPSETLAALCELVDKGAITLV